MVCILGFVKKLIWMYIFQSKTETNMDEHVVVIGEDEKVDEEESSA